ncbi:MAG TPA: endolytic transglycosylase MltG [Candidatus Acidoferrum sp.]|nr:endolytic transglycosylase MltG [Candidatus Acidoferrum sp.]
MIGKLFRLFLLLLVLAVGLAGGTVYWAFTKFHEPGPAAADTTVIIDRGLGVRGIADKLAEAGVISDPLVFAAGVRVYGEGQPLKAGEYLFASRLSMRLVMEQMIAGGTIQHRLTVPEGLTSAEIVALVAAAPDLDGAVPAALPADGTLLPETYFFSRGDTRAQLLERMRKGMQDALAELWPARDGTLTLANVAEAVTLASIVEKETAVPEERPHVASVFFNRLAKGMPLQSDPTVIYAVTGGKGPLGRPLSKADLQVANPYNTYVNAGLPPGPIANPGRASLQAVLHPDSTKDLYFVADGTGGHAFAATLDEHNKNVAAWRKQQAQQPQPQ